MNEKLDMSKQYKNKNLCYIGPLILQLAKVKENIVFLDKMR